MEKWSGMKYRKSRWYVKVTHGGIWEQIEEQGREFKGSLISK